MAREALPVSRSNRGTDQGQFHVPPPPSRFPESDPLWFRFVAWVLTGGVVRRTLLDEAKNGAWEIVWATYKAGAECGGRGG